MRLRTIFLVLCLVGLMPIGATAQPNPEVANCQEIKDPDTEFQAQVCSAHIACGFVMGVQRTCTKVKSFLRNLGTVVQNAGKRLTGTKDINAEDIFEAQIEPSLRRIEKDPEIKAKSDRIKAASKSAADSEPKEMTLSSGQKLLYYGELKDGNRIVNATGYGYVFSENGTSLRGTPVGGTGERESVTTQGGRTVSDMNRGKLDGRGAETYEGGLTFNGTYANGSFVQGTVTTPEGQSHAGRFEKIGNRYLLAEGQMSDRNGNLIARGKFSGGKLEEGEQRDPSGRMVAVGAPPVQQAALPLQNVQPPQRPQQAVAQSQALSAQQPQVSARSGQSSSSASGPLLPIGPGWKVVTTSSGCKILWWEPRGASNFLWTGQCVAGFAHGAGTLDYDASSDNVGGGMRYRRQGTMFQGVSDGRTEFLFYRGDHEARKWGGVTDPAILTLGCGPLDTEKFGCRPARIR